MDAKETTVVYPLGRNRSVVIDPQIQWGDPTIKGTRIPTASLYGPFTAGDPIAVIADWFELTPEQVEDAIRYEVMSRCKHGRKAIKKATAKAETSPKPQAPAR